MTEPTTPQTPTAKRMRITRIELADEQTITVPRRRWYSLRLVRTATLDELRADIAQPDHGVKRAEAIADQWNAAYTREATFAERAERRADELAKALDGERRTATQLRGAGREVAAILSDGDARLDDAIRGIAAVLIKHAPAFRIDPELVRRGEKQLAARGGETSEAMRGQDDRATAEARTEQEQTEESLAGAYRYPHDSTPALIGDHLGPGRCEACAAALPSLPDEELIAALKAAIVFFNLPGSRIIHDEATRRGLDITGLIQIRDRLAESVHRRLAEREADQ
ncbi:hypothetical protein [Streptomyces klenkii]